MIKSNKIQIINNTGDTISNLVIKDQDSNLITEISSLKGNSKKVISLNNEKSLFLTYYYDNVDTKTQNYESIEIFNTDKRNSGKVLINSIDNHGKLDIEIR
jgi:hypothetical protein